MEAKRGTAREREVQAARPTLKLAVSTAVGSDRDGERQATDYE
jgi:hypothetical protein